MNIYDLISRAQKLRKETQLDSVSPDRVGGLHEDTLKYINEFQLLASSPSLHKIYASVSAMQSDKSPKSDLTGKPLKPGQLVVIVPANQTDATAGDVYRYDGPSGNTSAWTFVAKIGAVPADSELSATSTNSLQNKVVTEKLTELESEVQNTESRINASQKALESRVNTEIEDFKDAVTDQVESYKPIVINGDVTNAADEEDITSENNLLKLKDRSALNGMGYVILRKNKTFAEQVSQPNTIYEIRYEFDLKGSEVTIPNNCVLNFQGGFIKNGIVEFTDTEVSSEYTAFINVAFKGELATNQPIKAFVFGDKSSDFNSLFQCAKKATIILPQSFILDVTLRPNPDNSLIWQSGKVVIRNNITFLEMYRSTGIVDFSGSYILVPSSQTSDVIVFRGHKAGNISHNVVINSGGAYKQRYDFGSVFGDYERGADVPHADCIGLHIIVDKRYDDGYLYNCDISISANCIGAACSMSVSSENGTTNTTDNVYNITSWDCDYGLILESGQGKKISLDFSEINLFAQPGYYARKALHISNPIGTEAAGNATFKMSVWDEVYFKDKPIVDTLQRATYIDTLLEGERNMEVFAGVSKGFPSKSHFKYTRYNHCVIDNAHIIQYYILAGCNTSMTGDELIKKIILNTSQYVPQNNVTIRTVFSIDSNVRNLLPATLYNIFDKIFIGDFPYYALLDCGVLTISIEAPMAFSANKPYKMCKVHFDGMYFEMSQTHIITVENGEISLDTRPLCFTSKMTSMLPSTPLAGINNSNYRDHKVHWDDVTNTPKIHTPANTLASFRYLEIPMIYKTSWPSVVADENPLLTTANSKGVFFVYLENKKKHIFWNGTRLSDLDGAAADVARSGISSNRPIGSNIYVGFMYFDTTLGKPIYAKSISSDTVTWVDAMGANV